MKNELALFKEISNNYQVPLELLESMGLRYNDYPELALSYIKGELRVIFIFSNENFGYDTCYKSFKEVLQYYPELNK